MKQLIKNMALPEAEALFASLGDKPYRARQLFSWLYEKNISSFEEMSNFSKALRAQLAEKYDIGALTLEERLISKIDATEKFLFRTRDGMFIESVLLKNHNTDEGRITVCISSQVGCAMGCSFCSTAKLGFKRNLEVGEILDQISQVRRITGIINNNVVFMGMGEPFMNYDNLIKACQILNYDFGFCISVRKITISTCGVLPMIERYINEEQPYNLAISLNDTETDKRRVNMPIEKSYSITEIAKLLNRKMPASRNRLTLEYVLRKDNISKADAERIKKMFKFAYIKLNLIPLNSKDKPEETPTKAEIEKFIDYCGIINIPISIRKSLGTDISGACGQLAGKKYEGCDEKIIVAAQE